MQDIKQTPSSPPIYRSYSPLSTTQAKPVRAASKQRPQWLRSVVIVMAIFITARVGYGWLSGRIQAIAPKTQTTHAAALPDPGPQLASNINALIAAHPDLDIGVGIVDIKTGKSLVYGDKAPFEAASTGKLLTAVLFLHQVEVGKDSLNETIAGNGAQTELQKLIVDSDNTAWEAFNNGTLGHQALQTYANSLGLTSYSADNNTINAANLATLLQKLYSRKLLNNEHTNLLLSFMKNANEGDYIPAAVPSGVVVYHKAGWLDDRVHDAAIIDNGQRPFTLVIMTKNQLPGTTYNTTTGQQLFHDITRTSTTAFFN